MTSASNQKPVVTRFAPSPTGYLHIGGARTALFNYLYARATGGKYLVRIEDTDARRSTPEAIAAIHDGLDWLGLLGDEEPVFQSQRTNRHAEVANALLEKGAAYKCYLTQDELQARREAAQAAKKPYRIDSEWREREAGPDQDGQPFVVRLKAPKDGETVIEDAVQGRIAVKNAEIDDFILLRSDGSPTYMLAVVVDDHDMGVTHIMRGDDHLNNAFRQLPLIHAMGWDEPTYAHVPLIHGADGAKLSKRHGAMGVDAYRDEMGLMPEAVFNYLLRLGWGHGDAEIIDREQAIEWFDLKGIGKSPSRFDTKKLLNLNGHYIREADDERLADLVLPRLAVLGFADPDRDLLVRAMPELKARARDLDELAEGSTFLFKSRPLEMADNAADLLDDDARAILGKVHAALGDAPCWNIETVENLVRTVAEEADLKLGKLAQPLRAAVTGSNTSPGIFDVLVLLGRDEALARIADQMND